MNFRPTLWKVVLSVIPAIVLGIFSGRGYYIGSSKIFYNPLGIFVGFVIFFAIIYAISSLLQQKQ